MILAAGADVDLTEDVLGATALVKAALAGFEEICTELVQAGAFVDTATTEGMTPLIAAAQGGHSSIVDMLLRHDADMDARDLSGLCALHHAVLQYSECEHSSTATLGLLLETGADLKLTNVGGDTALLMACRQPQDTLAQTAARTVMVSTMLEASAEVNQANNQVPNRI